MHHVKYIESSDPKLTHSLVTSIYQSNGACQTTCAGYALGVLQGNRCWCTNVAPSESSQTDVSDCATGCPGYPADSCGSASEGVYAYVAVVGNSVTSTAGGGGDKTSSTSSSSKSTSTTSSTSVRKLPLPLSRRPSAVEFKLDTSLHIFLNLLSFMLGLGCFAVP